MKIGNNIPYVNSNNLKSSFKGKKNIPLQKANKPIISSVKNTGHKGALLAIAGLFLGGIAFLQALSTGVLEFNFKETKENIENFVSNAKEQHRINKLPDGPIKESEQAMFDMMKMLKE